MVFNGFAMWMLTVVVAFVASISACTGPSECSNNTISRNASESLNNIECLDRLTTVIGDLSACECHIWSRNDTSTILEVKCLEGIPVIDTLPDNVQSLVIQRADVDQVTSMFRELENSSLICLSELTVVNVSLSESNITLPHVCGLVVLNISGNDLVDLSDVRLANDSDLKILDLSSNQLSELPANAFRTLTGLVHLRLRNNIIDTVNEDAFAGLEALENLDVSDNRLTQLPDATLTHLSSLQTLNLSGNQLKILGARWFEALGRLRELDVSRNGLTKAASGALQPLPGLSVLRLAENPLMERDVSLLLGTGRRLETVDASRTGLLRVPAALTRSVRALRLAGNKLTCIRDGDFDGYPLLKILDLSDNLLNVVEEDSLGRLETLEELDLSGNRLKFMPKRLPSSLIYLNLRGNLIEDVAFNDLDGIDSIHSLMLDDNMIENIEEGALSQLPHLTELDISNNPIKQLPANTLAGPTSLTKLRMSGLIQLEWEHERRGDMAFPVPTPERLIYLDVSNSPALAAQLLADNAALSACKSLLVLNLANTNITNIRSDLVYLLPQLQTLGLSDNQWNCSSDLFWLGEWIRQHEEIQPPAKCNSTDEFTDTQLEDLPPPPTTTTSTTVSTTIADSSDNLRIEVLPGIGVPNVSSKSGSVRVTTESMMKGIVNVTTVEITTVETRQHKVHSAELGADNESPDETSTTSQTIFVGVGDSRQLKSGKKPQSIMDNDKAYDRGEITRKFDKTGSRKIPDSGKFISASFVERHKLREILDNRVDSLMRPTASVPNKSGIYTTTGSDSFNNVPKPRSSNKIAWDSRTRGNIPTTNNVVQLVEDKTKNTPQNYILANAIANTIAQELNGRATETDARISEPMGAHPGMLVLAGAILGAAAALTVVLSRRATIRRRDRYHRHENIEVHTLTPTTELW
ncbi:slit homolog 2 protein [Diachasma alloeum]|uniref:slit homolog 2 protein n=1 Tax=Diachasma alloeum TaxID=454923 RepID=UPI0007382628|nr:slit homolog 2 protein [Diachasma alloeum]